MKFRPPPRFRAHTRAFALASLLMVPLAAAGSGTDRQANATEPPTSAVSRVWTRAQDLAIFALGLIGVDYRFGGTTPDAGLDCSGLVRYVFQQVTGITLPRTSQEMSHLGKKVAAADLKVGDLVFFNTRTLPFSHVGIYLGDDRFVHAPSRGGAVEIAAMSASYWRTRFSGARRLPVVTFDPPLATSTLARAFPAGAETALAPDPDFAHRPN